MWQLEAYDDSTELIAETYPLPGISGDAIRQLIEVDETELPLEMGPYPVLQEDVHKFSRYIEGEFDVDPRRGYFVGLFAD